MDHLKEAPDYLQDDHLSRGTKAYLKVLNGGAPVESLPVGEARRVLTDVQAAVHVDLSGIEESERTVESEGYTLRLNLVRPSGAGRVHLPAFVFIHGGGWVLGDYPTHRRLVRDLVVESGCAAVFVNYTPSPEAHFPKAVEEVYAAVKWVAENGREIGVDGSRLALAGNSVGGNMSLAAVLKTVESDPFVERNAAAFVRMGIAAEAAGLVFFVKCFFMFTIMTAVCALVMILSGLFALTLGMVFRRAVEYKRENELTI